MAAPASDAIVVTRNGVLSTYHLASIGKPVSLREHPKAKSWAPQVRSNNVYAVPDALRRDVPLQQRPLTAYELRMSTVFAWMYACVCVFVCARVSLCMSASCDVCDGSPLDCVIPDPCRTSGRAGGARGPAAQG